MTPAHARPALAVPHDRLRALFPSLAQEVNGHPAVFLDGPGGTQTPGVVIEAMAGYLSRDNANLGGAFVTSERTVATVAAARRDVAEFLHASRPEEIVFGQNKTSLTFSLAHALGRTWHAGDEVVITSLDHDANVAPWVLAAEDAGATVRTWELRREDCALYVEDLEPLLNERTRLVALTHGSNIVGSIPDVAAAVRQVRAQAPDALVFIDAVHYTPHNPVDVQALDCDFLGCSAYKFCGPHLGILYGKYAHLDGLKAYKVRASTNLPPGKWETGTQSFESIAALRSCLGYLASLDDEEGPGRLRRALERVKEYEATLSRRFLENLFERVPGVTLHGRLDPADVGRRTPTFALTLANHTPRQVAEHLGQQGIFVGDGHYYAIAVVDRLGLADKGGVVRLGFAHYNTPEEVDRVINALAALAQS